MFICDKYSNYFLFFLHSQKIKIPSILGEFNINFSFFVRLFCASIMIAGFAGVLKFVFSIFKSMISIPIDGSMEENISTAILMIYLYNYSYIFLKYIFAALVLNVTIISCIKKFFINKFSNKPLKLEKYTYTSSFFIILFGLLLAALISHIVFNNPLPLGSSAPFGASRSFTIRNQQPTMSAEIIYFLIGTMTTYALCHCYRILNLRSQSQA